MVALVGQQVSGPTRPPTFLFFRFLLFLFPLRFTPPPIFLSTTPIFRPPFSSSSCASFDFFAFCFFLLFLLFFSFFLFLFPLRFLNAFLSFPSLQVLMGARIPDGFSDRTLPHFQVHSKEPAAKVGSV
jgi:hypothetical protein